MRTKIKVIVTGGREYEEAKKEGLPNWICWDTSRKFYVGQSYRKFLKMMRYRLIPFSTYTKEIEI